MNRHNPNQCESSLETILLDAMMKAGLKPVVQHPTRSGFILDFAFPDKKIGIEVDGHPSHFTFKGKRRDRFRDKILKRGGWKMIRFSELEIKNSSDNCIEKIKIILQ